MQQFKRSLTRRAALEAMQLSALWSVAVTVLTASVSPAL